MDKQEIIRDLRHTFIDYRLTRSEKRALGESLNQLSAAERTLLRHEVFDLASNELISPEAVEIVNWLEDTVKLLAPKSESKSSKSEVLFSPENNCVAKVCALFMQARQKVDVCVFTITDDRIASAIIAAHRRRVNIRIITDDTKAEDLGSDICFLREQGIQIRTDKTPDHMHHKYAVFDQNQALTGSYNWTRNASIRNEENLVVTNDDNLVNRFSEHFEKLWLKYGRA